MDLPVVTMKCWKYSTVCPLGNFNHFWEHENLGPKLPKKLNAKKNKCQNCNQYKQCTSVPLISPLLASLPILQNILDHFSFTSIFGKSFPLTKGEEETITKYPLSHFLKYKMVPHSIFPLNEPYNHSLLGPYHCPKSFHTFIYPSPLLKMYHIRKLTIW